MSSITYEQDGLYQSLISPGLAEHPGSEHGTSSEGAMRMR